MNAARKAGIKIIYTATHLLKVDIGIFSNYIEYIKSKNSPNLSHVDTKT